MKMLSCVLVVLLAQTSSRPMPPTIQDRDWIQIPLDAFVLHRLESTGRKPAGEADRPTLLRQATRVLVGRDETSEEFRDYLTSRDRRAYEKAIDRLIESPEFAERFAPISDILRDRRPASARQAALSGWRRFFPKADDDHREAVEWLAWEVMEPTLINCCDLDRIPRAWDVKHLAKTIAISATFRDKIAWGASAASR